jgi:hypothetical protein
MLLAFVIVPFIAVGSVNVLFSGPAKAGFVVDARPE